MDLSEAKPLRELRVLDDAAGILSLKVAHGQCALLLDNQCTAYASRPRGCREYPWYRFDDVLWFDSACPGMERGIEGRPNLSEVAEGSRFFGSPGIVRTLVLAAVRRW